MHATACQATAAEHKQTLQYLHMLLGSSAELEIADRDLNLAQACLRRVPQAAQDCGQVV